MNEVTYQHALQGMLIIGGKMNQKKIDSKSGFYYFIAMIALASTILPLVFESKITLSPMLIFAIIIIGKLSNHIAPKTENNETIFDRHFFTSLAISVLFSSLLIFSYKFSFLLS